MAEIWPAQLQDFVNEQSFSLEIGSTTIRSETEIGPGKVRRRFTKSVDKMNVSINLTQALYDTFYTFYDVDLNGGANTFLFNHPISGEQKEMRIMGQPTFSPLGGGNFVVNMTWEIMP